MNDDGYLTVKLSKDSSSTRYFVHRLVAIAFLGDCEGMEINHIDYDRTNNSLENLEWCTHKENIKHSSTAGRYKLRDISGENNPNYGNHVLADRYKNKELAKEVLSRPGKQNGNCRKVELYDEAKKYIKTFDWIGECCEYLRSKKLTKSKVDYLRDKIRIAAKEETIYLHHYYKIIA